MNNKELVGRTPSSSNISKIHLYLNFSMAGWSKGQGTHPHQVCDAGSIPAPAMMNKLK